jgi:cation:H+ antiporter
MIIEFVSILFGVLIILLLSQIIINNAIKLADHFGLSHSFIGLTVLSIGTSIPEIVTHVIGSINILSNPSSIDTLSGLLIGTNIGSDIFQQNFILPVVGIIGTIVVIKKNLISEVGGLIAAAMLVLIFSIGGYISRTEGFILLLAYFAYLLYLKLRGIKEKFNSKNHLKKNQVIISIILVILAFIIVSFVADFVLNQSEKLVQLLPLSASFFGIIILGVATALPELMTSLVAIIKKKSDISAGILIGSNITNPLFGIGLGALISGYTVPNVVIYYDLPFKIVTAVLIFIFLMSGRKLKLWESILLIISFLAYLFVRSIYFPVDF